MGIEGFDGQLDNGGISGCGDVDAAGRKNGSFVVVDLDIYQASGFAAGNKEARAVLGFDDCDTVGIEAASDEAYSVSGDIQFGCWQHQVVFDQ